MPDFKPHLFLNNPRGEKKHFDPRRGRNDEEEENVEPKPPQSYRPQKNRLNNNLAAFTTSRTQRAQNRTLDIPTHLEYIIIDFLVVFSNSDALKTKDRFLNQFGLSPVMYFNFNQSVLFAITSEEKFLAFKSILEAFINSSDQTAPQGTNYAIATIIQGFQFLSTEQILTDDLGSDVIVDLIIPSSEIVRPHELIYKNLINYLNTLQVQKPGLSFSTDEFTSIEIRNIEIATIQEIIKNYDIAFKVHSLRVPTIRENEYNQPELTWDITINPPDSDIKIGIIDNGVRPIDPMAQIIVDYGFDITNPANPNPLKATHTHGTVVASLAALGLDYFDTTRKIFTADAYIVPIKILDFANGYLNIYEIEKVITRAIKRGVKIFNLSVCGPTINYNSPVSEYAYLLDRLAYKYDILIFIATGNLGYDEIVEMQRDVANGNNIDLHTYPNHFYNPSKASMIHNCECSNLCIPGESYNNITVGAIADNGIDGSQTGLTPFKELPAYYTLKHPIDYNKKLNGTNFKKSQKNLKINKPDLVMPGGDLLDNDSKMQVFGFGATGDFYTRGSGTSYAAPLACNIAAKVVKMYPALNMQSVKSLILNGAEKLLRSEFLDDLINGIKEQEAQNGFGKAYGTLDRKEKLSIDSRLSSDTLYDRLTGHGKPEIDKVLHSDKKSVTMVIQDSIFADSYKVINLNIPDYLLNYTKPSHIITLRATLCFKFYPILNNQLSYNPVHISFNFIKSLEKGNPTETSDIISNREHGYYDQFYEDLELTGEGSADAKKKLTARNKAIAIKANLQSWSDDFSPISSKPFSNVQKLDLNINKEEISKVDQQISIVVRCTCKRDIDPNLIEWLKKNPHEFSIAINLSEKENDELGDHDLYDELIACNELDSIVVLDTEAELEGDLDLDLDLEDDES